VAIYNLVDSSISGEVLKYVERLHIQESTVSPFICLKTWVTENGCPTAWSLESNIVGVELVHGEPTPIIQWELMWLCWTPHWRLLFEVTWFASTEETLRRA
jgi:hypothetical protein